MTINDQEQLALTCASYQYNYMKTTLFCISSVSQHLLSSVVSHGLHWHVECPVVLK